MDTDVGMKLEVAAQVRDFLLAHPLDGDSYVNALGQFEVRLVKAQRLVDQQLAGTIGARAAIARRQEVKRVLSMSLLRHLVRVGIVAAKDNPELAGQFELPRANLRHQVFVAATRGMLEKAKEHKEVLLKEGMSETLLDDLTAAVGEFDAATTANNAGRRAHVGAHAELEGVTAEIMDRIRLLDGLVRYRFKKEGEILAAWKTASHVPIHGRKAKAKNGGVAPAA